MGRSLSDPPIPNKMNEAINEIQRLLQEIVELQNSRTMTNTRKTVAKLERIAAVVSTLALTIRAGR